MERDQAIKRIKELCALRKSGKISDEEKAELAKLQDAFPKGKGSKQSNQKKGNDMSYWDKYPALTKDASNIPWNFIPGTAMLFSANREYVFPNIMRFSYLRTPGICRSTTDAFNLQMRELWLTLHRKYRGIGTYEFQDLAIVLFCICDIFVDLSEAERIYGLLHAYPVGNRAFPRSILLAAGYSSDFINQVEQNLADFRYQINRLITKCDQLCLPKGITALYSSLGLSSFVYADSKNERASAYIFKKAYSWKFVDNTLHSGSAAVAAYNDNTVTQTVTSYFSFIEDGIDRLLNNSDVARMCSDLLAWLGPNNVDTLQLMDEQWKVTLSYDESILHKIHNAEFISVQSSVGEMQLASTLPSNDADDVKGYITSDDTPSADRSPLWLIQNGDRILFDPLLVVKGTDKAEVTGLSTVTNKYVICDSARMADGPDPIYSPIHVLDTWKEAPGTEEVFEGSLFKVNPTGVNFTATKAATAYRSLGVEVLLNIKMFKGWMGSAENAGTIYPANRSISMWSGTIPTRDNLATMVSAYTKFDWAPVLLQYSDHSMDIMYGDVDHITSISEDAILRIHDVCVLSGYKIPTPASGDRNY